VTTPRPAGLHAETVAEAAAARHASTDASTARDANTDASTARDANANASAARDASAEAGLRDGCVGVAPLSARLEPWQVELCSKPELISAWMEEHGSPVNLIDPAPMGSNAAGLASAAARGGVDLGIYFARKANKALALVD
jgi:hypothetical protein